MGFWGSIYPYVFAVQNGTEVVRSEVHWKIQRPRFDLHVKIGFGAFTNREKTPGDAQIFDEGKLCDGDLVPQVWTPSAFGSDTFSQIGSRRSFFFSADMVPSKMRCVCFIRVFKRKTCSLFEFFEIFYKFCACLRSCCGAWGISSYNLISDLASNTDYEKEKGGKAATSRTAKETKKKRIAQARNDFAVWSHQHWLYPLTNLSSTASKHLALKLRHRHSCSIPKAQLQRTGALGCISPPVPQ